MSKPVVASCRTGMSACSLMMALMMAGATDYTMYHVSHHYVYSFCLFVCGGSLTPSVIRALLRLPQGNARDLIS